MECLDKIKATRGAASRAQLVEEALRLFSAVKLSAD
ncbi:hypothetical protein [Mesorhizobium sp. M1006]